MTETDQTDQTDQSQSLDDRRWHQNCCKVPKGTEAPLLFMHKPKGPILSWVQESILAHCPHCPHCTSSNIQLFRLKDTLLEVVLQNRGWLCFILGTKCPQRLLVCCSAFEGSVSLNLAKAKSSEKPPTSDISVKKGLNWLADLTKQRKASDNAPRVILRVSHWRHGSAQRRKKLTFKTGSLDWSEPRWVPWLHRCPWAVGRSSVWYSVKFRQILKRPCVVVISWLLRSPPNLRIPLANLVCKSNFPKSNSKSIGALAAQTTKQNERFKIDLCLDIPNSFCEPILGVEIPDPQSSHAGTADQAQSAEKRVLRFRLAVSHSATVFSQPYCQAYAISMQLMQQNSNPNSKLACIAFVAGKRLTMGK